MERLPDLAGRSVPELVELGKQAIEEAGTFEEVQEIRASAAALQTYQKSIGAAEDALNAAAEIKLRAERRMGEELAKVPRDEGGRPAKGVTSCDGFSAPTAADLGLHRQERKRLQDLAAIPEETFDATVDAHKEASEPITTAGVARIAKQAQQEKWSPSDIKAAVKEAARDAAMGGKKLPTPSKAREISRETGAMVLASDGQYHGYTTPEQDSATNDWFAVKEALWPLGTLKVSPARAVEVVPDYQHQNIEAHMRAARAWLQEFEDLWHGKTNQSAA